MTLPPINPNASTFRPNKPQFVFVPGSQCRASEPRPQSRLLKVARWVLDNRRSRISHPEEQRLEAMLRDGFAEETRTLREFESQVPA